MLMKFVEDCAAAPANGETLCGVDVCELLEKTSIYIVPMVNPDGYGLNCYRGQDDYRQATCL